MKETNTRRIVNKFLELKAISEDKAIALESVYLEIEDIDKMFIINSLIDSNYLVKREDNKLWFNKGAWNKAIRKLTIQYSFIMGMPIIVAFVLYLVIF